MNLDLSLKVINEYKYDYVIVGAGMYGSTFARIATDNGKKVCILEKRHHIAGNCYSSRENGIDIHKYGPHIFHTSNESVWKFLNRFCAFSNFINSPLAFSNNELYALPFNMHTFNKLWGTKTPAEAICKLNAQRENLDRPPENLEEQALALVGRDIYECLIKNYTIKQWKEHPKNLPAEIIRRLPLRYTYDTNYFNDKYQGIPKEGYTCMFENMLNGIEVKLNIDFLSNKEYWESQGRHIVYTGNIDKYFNYEFGDLEYRTLDFFDTWHQSCNVQGNAVINYCDLEYPFTRKIEHRHFMASCDSDMSIITEEHPAVWSRDRIPYYPINNVRNQAIFNQYREKSKSLGNYTFGGRLAEYKYYDMHAVCLSALLEAQRHGLVS